jgi:mRNA interferase HicA
LKRLELERDLREHGCEQLREGANHAVWTNQARDLRSPILRHREIPGGTTRAICRQLGVPPPVGSR